MCRGTVSLETLVEVPPDYDADQLNDVMLSGQQWHSSSKVSLGHIYIYIIYMLHTRWNFVAVDFKNTRFDQFLFGCRHVCFWCRSKSEHHCLKWALIFLSWLYTDSRKFWFSICWGLVKVKAIVAQDYVLKTIVVSFGKWSVIFCRT